MRQDKKDPEPRLREGQPAVGREPGKIGEGLRKPGPHPVPQKPGENDFPGKPRKRTKKEVGFEPDPDVEAGHEDDDRPGSGEP